MDYADKKLFNDLYNNRISDVKYLSENFGESDYIEENCN